VSLAAALAGAGLARGACYGIAVLVTLAAAGLYRDRISTRVSDQAGRLALAAAVPAAILLPWTAAGLTLRLAGIATALVIGLRIVAGAGLRTAGRHGLLTRRTLIIGAGEAGERLAAQLRQHPQLGLQLCGLVDDTPAAPRTAPLLGSVPQAGRLVTGLGISQVLVVTPAVADEDLLAAVRDCRARGARVSMLPRLPEVGAAVPRACLDEIWGMPFIPLRPDAGSVTRRAAKRAIDLSAGAALLLLMAPLMLVLAAAVRLEFRLPPLFRQDRVVGRGREATIVKLRTLRPAGNPDTTWVIPAGQSSPLGRVLRATHADELPQLASVLRGDLSLVGPRPERPYFARQLAREIRGYADRERVSAGLTGWAQVHGLTGDTSIEDRARFDNFYIEYWSVWLDLLILVRTLTSALSGAMHSARGGTA
jgi:exopolysaccharide biosynthesis polyprenyl glycosylphosphotransferase